MAHARYEEASRSHNAKRDEVNAAAAAAGQNQRCMAEAIAASHQQRKGEEREDCASLHSLARSCEAAAASETDTPPVARTPTGGDRQDSGRTARTGEAATAAVTGDGNGNADDRRSGDVRRYSAAAPAGDAGVGGGGRTPDVAGRSSSTEAIGSPRKSSRSSVSATDVADEMREVKLEAALLCGIGRGPPRRAADASADKNGTAAGSSSSSFSSSVGDKRKIGGGGLQRSSSSSPGGTGGRSNMSRTSSAPHLPALRHGGGEGGGGGAFLPPALSAHPADAAGANRAGGAGNRLPSMDQMPGSPSVSGETDSDHSDSMGGGGGDDNTIGIAPKQHQRLSPGSGGRERGPGMMKTPNAAGRESWGGYARRDGGGGNRHVAPLASLATATARGGNGLSCA